MSDYLCISVTFLDPRFHGRGDGGEPEWPPSPLRLLQAVVSANADTIGIDGELDGALKWMESQGPPVIVAPPSEECEPYCLSVPNNAMDVVGRAWSRGTYFGGGDANPAKHRTMKTICATRMVRGDTVHYLWKLNESTPDDHPPITALIKAAKRMVALGWGVDFVAGHARRIAEVQLRALPGERWLPSASSTVAVLRVPMAGTLDALRSRYNAFLHRIGPAGFAPVEPLTRFAVWGYRRPGDPVSSPHAVFELRRDDGTLFRYPQSKLIHIAGMVRHLAIETMKMSPPHGVLPDDWVRVFVAGHRRKDGDDHRQFSYLPLPSVGHPQTDPGVRRVMIVAPIGREDWLDHLAMRLAGQPIKPSRRTPIAAPPSLIRIRGDNVTRRYTKPVNTWASVTPVILPGHDDHKPAKTVKLIESALAQSGIEQPCHYEWRAVSWFPKSLSAHKYDRGGKPTGYIRPDHLLTQTAVHVKLHFDGLEVPGPLAIGAGRHCGFGLLAALD